MSDHEFTTAEVREAFVEYQHDFIDVDAWGFAGDWFNRWFAGELEKARADEREKAVGDAIDRISSACFKARHQKVEVAVLATRNAYTFFAALADAMRAARGDTP